MERIMSVFYRLLTSQGSLIFLPLTVMRVSFGLFYFSSGFNKVFVPENELLMLETIIDARIPFPHLMAGFVATSEMIWGMLLALGLFTRLGALILITISMVALVTVGLNQIPAGIDVLSWYSWLLYLPESSYILMSFMLIIQGCGPLGLDRLVSSRYMFSQYRFNTRSH